MAWWGWIIGGAVLFGAELFFIDAQFHLVFVGSSALIVGVSSFAMPDLPEWAQWGLFAVLSIASMVGFRRKVYALVRGHAPAVRTGPVNDLLTLPVALAAHQSCQAEHAGSFWTIRNDTDAALGQGTRVRVVRVEGLTLEVRPES